MAKVEMDISEYEMMKENKKLLENSLEKERILQEEIKKLTDEKLKAYEDAKMKVVKTTTTEHNEYVMVKNNPHDIVRKLGSLLGINGLNYFKTPSEFSIDNLISTFFTVVKTKSFPTTTVETVGLNEIKEDIRKELNGEINESIKTKLENYDKLLEENSNLVKENKDITDSLSF